MNLHYLVEYFLAIISLSLFAGGLILRFQDRGVREPDRTHGHRHVGRVIRHTSHGRSSPVCGWWVLCSVCRRRLGDDRHAAQLVAFLQRRGRSERSHHRALSETIDTTGFAFQHGEPPTVHIGGSLFAAITGRSALGPIVAFGKLRGDHLRAGRGSTGAPRRQPINLLLLAVRGRRR